MYSSTLREINEVRQMSVGQLRAKWRELYGEDTRSRNRDYLFRRLAWRLQELQHGGLSDRAKERIEELAPDRFVRARTPIVAPSVSSLVERVEHRPVRDPRLPSPGTVIVKQWRGRELRLLVHDDGFELEGRMFRSLSEAARHVAGVRWNGWVFWGLKQRRRS